MLDLVLPLACGGCGAPSTRWCPQCARELVVGFDQPHVVTPRLDPGVPVFSLGRYAGARRRAIVAVKEHGRTDLLEPLAAALRCGITRLLGWGVIDSRVVIVPAPTRWSSARRRGGDPVTKLAVRATRGTDVEVCRALRMRWGARDSVGLSSASRQRNVAGRVKLVRTPPRTGVLLVDDIITTGATAAESVAQLHSGGACVVGMLSLAHA